MNKIRWNASRYDSPNYLDYQCKVQVYTDGNWITVYEDWCNHGEWTNSSVFNSTTGQLKFNFYNLSGAEGHLFEIEIYEVYSKIIWLEDR
jgi:hypothetical protein